MCYAPVTAVYQADDSASNQHWDDIYRETRNFSASDELREWPFEVRFPAGKWAVFQLLVMQRLTCDLFRVAQEPTSTSPSL